MISFPLTIKRWAITVVGYYLGLCTVLFCVQALASSQTSVNGVTQDREYELKAMFLVAFLKFVEWPEENLDEEGKIIIGILGEDLFGDSFDRMIKKDRVLGRKVIVEHYGNFQEGMDFSKCKLLFISISERRNLSSILKHVKQHPALVVGEFQEFIERGGMINLFVENNRIRYEVNKRATNRAGLRIASHVLWKATRVLQE